MSTIGKKIKSMREVHGWTQAKLAELIGVSSNYIARFEGDEFKNPTIETIERFAKALEVTSQYLLFGIEDILPPNAEPAPYIPNDIPEVGVAQAGRGRYFDNDGLPAGEWPKKFHRPVDITDPHAYVVRVDGDSMEPFLKKGNKVLAVTDREAKHGDYVVAQLNSGEVMVKELAMHNSQFIFKSINPLHDPIVVKKSEIRAVHPVVWIKRG